MDLNIEISDGKLENVSTEGQNELKGLAGSFVVEVLDESIRREATLRTTPKGHPEITASIIHDAYNYVRKFHIKPKKAKWVLPVQIIALLTTLGTGIMFSKADLSKPGWIVASFAISGIAVATNVILFIKD